MKHLKVKQEFKFTGKKPDKSILDTFPKPSNIHTVVLLATEVTSLCPITKQPDYHNIRITYCPLTKCVESKSLKLYLGGYRMVGTFTETLSSLIQKDLEGVLDCWVEVDTSSAPRGGIAIQGTADSVGEKL